MQTYSIGCAVVLLSLEIVILVCYLFASFTRENRNKVPEEYATAYGKLLAEEDPKGFFTIPDIKHEVDSEQKR